MQMYCRGSRDVYRCIVELAGMDADVCIVEGVGMFTVVL